MSWLRRLSRDRAKTEQDSPTRHSFPPWNARDESGGVSSRPRTRQTFDGDANGQPHDIEGYEYQIVSRDSGYYSPTTQPQTQTSTRNSAIYTNGGNRGRELLNHERETQRHEYDYDARMNKNGSISEPTHRNYSYPTPTPYSNSPINTNTNSNGAGSTDLLNGSGSSAQSPQSPTKMSARHRTHPQQLTDTNGAGLAAAPDPLTRAFNEALKPYTSQIDLLKAQLAESNHRVAVLEDEKTRMHAWIDKKGLRPDLPSDLADSTPPDLVSASKLSTQLDRKMTMLNYSLHQLADSLPTPLPASTVTATLGTILGSIDRLSLLPSGPSFAFETLIKLAGNLNSHSTGDETREDHVSIANFYDVLDAHMLGVVGRRMQSEVEDEWDVGRDVRRLERTGAFLRKEMGVRNYFTRAMEVMRGSGNEEGQVGSL